jgi:hypothetical protein
MRQPIFGKYILVILLVSALLVPASSFSADQAPVAPPQTLYIIPFLNVMIPAEVSSQLFDAFIDQMMTAGEQSGMQIRILKKDIDLIDKEWLARQFFVTGELFDYIEDSGCCSTEIEAKVRVYLYQPGSISPKEEIVVPGDIFFAHDISTLEKERLLLANRMALELSQQLIAELVPAQ